MRILRNPWRRSFLLGGVVLLAGVLFVFVPESWLRRGWNWSIGRLFQHTVESRLRQFGPAALARLELGFIPEKLDIIALKEERILELWGSRGSGKPELLKSYPVLAASGTAGPKLKEGDGQVPEGFYSIESLHPNSSFYLALKIAYPSEEDKRIAIAEKRNPDQLGSAIMLHGKGGSTGCIAVSNEAIEEIFALAARTGIQNIRLFICPYDFRHQSPPENRMPAWLSERYRRLELELKRHPRP